MRITLRIYDAAKREILEWMARPEYGDSFPTSAVLGAAWCDDGANGPGTPGECSHCFNRAMPTVRKLYHSHVLSVLKRMEKEGLLRKEIGPSHSITGPHGWKTYHWSIVKRARVVEGKTDA